MSTSDRLRAKAGRLDIATMGAECDSSAAMERADIGCFFDNVKHRVLG